MPGENAAMCVQYVCVFLHDLSYYWMCLSALTVTYDDVLKYQLCDIISQ